jgi:hypothetical protein
MVAKAREGSKDSRGLELIKKTHLDLKVLMRPNN